MEIPSYLLSVASVQTRMVANRIAGVVAIVKLRNQLECVQKNVGFHRNVAFKMYNSNLRSILVKLSYRLIKSHVLLL